LGATYLAEIDKEYHQALNQTDLDANGFFTIPNFHGQDINITDGQRLVTGQPEKAPYTLYFFGSSTGLDLNVPDNLTTASRLQARIGLDYRVVNMSMTGRVISQNFYILQKLALRPGDLVLYYAGANEIYNIYATAQLRRENAPPRPLCTILDTQYQSLALVQRYCNPLQYEFNAPPEMNDSISLENSVKEAVQTFHQTILQAQQFTEARGATFYLVLQPTIWSRLPASDDERRILANALIIPPGEEKVFTVGWPLLQTTAQDLPTIDLTHVLDNARSQIPLFIDCCHTNDYGMAIIAHAIVDALDF
jgi:hypothetical protein